MNCSTLVGLAATCLLLTGCGTSVEPTPPQDAPAEPRSEEAGGETLRTWVNALATGDGASGCAVVGFVETGERNEGELVIVLPPNP